MGSAPPCTVRRVPVPTAVQLSRENGWSSYSSRSFRSAVTVSNGQLAAGTLAASSSPPVIRPARLIWLANHHQPRLPNPKAFVTAECVSRSRSYTTLERHRVDAKLDFE